MLFRSSEKDAFVDSPDEPAGAAPAQAAQTQAPIEPPVPERMEPERTDSGPRLDLDIDSLFREAMPPPPLTVDTAAGSPDDTAAPALTYEQASGDPALAAVAEQAGASEKEAFAHADSVDEPALAASGRHGWRKNDEPSAKKGEDDR